MRCAILSDVHANLPALERVLATEEVQSADALICLGDSVGYHAQPNECLDHIRARAALTIAGNHDLAAVDRMDVRDFGRAAREAILWTRPRLSDSNRAFLEQLTIFSQFDSAFLCVHASLHPEPNVVQHLSNPLRVELSLYQLRRLDGPRLCFFGHTHRQVVHALADEARATFTRAELDLDRETYYLVNPGSVGQSRDGDPRAAFAVYDTNTRRLSFRRVEYDWAACEQLARSAGLMRQPTSRERAAEWLAARRDNARKRASAALHRLRQRLAR